MAPLVRRAIHSDRFPTPVASYSQGFQAGNMLFITGQLPVDPVTSKKVGDGDITLEARQVMENMMAVLEEAGFKHVAYENYAEGIVAVHDVWKLQPPLPPLYQGCWGY